MRREEQEEKVALLLGGLDKVGAPAGFETRVMRRISEGEVPHQPGSPVFLLALKFAVPAVLLLLAGVFFVFFGDGGTDTAAVPAVQETVSQPAPLGGPTNENAVNASTVSKVEDDSKPAGPPPTRKANIPAPSGSSVNSEDFAVKGPGETYMPPGIGPRPQNPDRSAVSSGRGGVRVDEVLGMIGINSKCTGDGCRVASVSKGGLAERAKLAAGDLIVSIDGRKIDGSTVFSGATSFKSFQVIRGGRTVTLSLSAN